MRYDGSGERIPSDERNFNFITYFLRRRRLWLRLKRNQLHVDLKNECVFVDSIFFAQTTNKLVKAPLFCLLFGDKRRQRKITRVL